MSDNEDDHEPPQPAQIPLLDDIVSEGKPPKRRRRVKREKNLDLDFETEPQVTGDLFPDLPTQPRDKVTTPDKEVEPGPPPSPLEPSEAIRAQATQMVDRLVQEYAVEMVHRLRDELTQLLEELEAPLDNREQNKTPVWDGPPIDAWQPWFPIELARRFETADVNWAVAGGWAIDLFLGYLSRDHHDIEIALPREEFSSLIACLGDCELFAAGGGDVRRLRHTDPVPAAIHQIWVVERETGQWRLDVLLEPGDASRWVYRRDPTIHRPRADVVSIRNGIPYLRPDIVLLFKAKHLRDQDNADFRQALPRLTSSHRAFLRTALEVSAPDHPWLDAL